MWNHSFPTAYIQTQQPIIYPIYYVPVVQGYFGQQNSCFNNLYYPLGQCQQEKSIVADVTIQPTEHSQVEQKEKQQEESVDSIKMSNKLKSKKYVSALNLSLKSTNISKNYAKAIILFMIRQRIEILQYLGEKQGIEFLKILTSLKNNIKNIKHIKKYLKDDTQLRLFRIIANRFLRKEAIGYVYNSNIKSTSHHLKQRNEIRLNLYQC
ncbi:unnamed protein product [Paramecium octaurelia]|uniref:Uncharacterized protein n=1 Tax=Paramecium octaurelia TaxID=43137 RepID=A0A8S1S3P5_PAROT|nr:unnamed protein product [Paramecium octaurelia]